MQAASTWTQLQAFASTLSYDVRLCNNGALPADRLAAISAPTLALAGATSPAWARDGARAIAGRVSGQAKVLAGQGHIIADEVLIPVLAKFLLSQPLT